MGPGAVEVVGIADRAAGDAGDGQGTVVGGNADAAGRNDGIAFGIQLEVLASDGDRAGLAVEVDRDGAGSAFAIAVRSAAGGEVGLVYLGPGRAGRRYVQGRHLVITGDLDGDGGGRGVPVLVGNGVAEGVFEDRTLGYVDTRSKDIGIGAVGIERQGAVLSLDGRADIAGQGLSAGSGRDAGDGLAFRCIGTEHVVVEDVAVFGGTGLGILFTDVDDIAPCLRHVVDDVDVERTAGGIAGLVGDGDGDVVGHRVIARLAVGLGAVERVGVLDRAAGDAGDGQGAAVGGNADAAGRNDGIAGRINGDAGAVDGEGGGFTVEAGDAEGAAGRCLVDVAGIAAAAGQVGFGHREFAAEDVQSVEDRCSRIGRRIGGAGNRLDFAQFGLATGHGELIEAFADAVKAHEGHAAFVATAPG